MEDKLINGFSVKNLIKYLITDKGCPEKIRSALHEELPAFEELRKNQTGRMSPGELFPYTKFVMDSEGLLNSTEQQRGDIVRKVKNIAGNLQIPLSDDEASQFVKVALNLKKE